MSWIEELAGWASTLRLEDCPSRVVEGARVQALSVIASRNHARGDEAAQSVLRAARNWPTGDVPTTVDGPRLHPHYAILVNAALSLVYDYDDYLLVGHTGHSTVCVSRALAHQLGASHDEALVAQIAGNEIGARLGFSSFVGPQNGQQLPFLHQACAAIVAGKLYGLDAEKMAHALAIALAQPPAPLWPAFLGDSGAKILVAAQPALNGVQAAELAATGMTCALDLLDHTHGFYRRFAFMPLPELLGGLGVTWLSDTIHLKPYPACAYHQTVFDALDGAIREAEGRGEAVTRNNIQRIEIETTVLAVTVSRLADDRRQPGALRPNDVNFSIPVGAAVYFTARRLTPAELQRDWLLDRVDELETLASRVQVKHNIEFSRMLLKALDDRLGMLRLLGQTPDRRFIEALPQWLQSFPGYPTIDMDSIEQLLPTVTGVIDLVSTIWNRDRAAAYDLAHHSLEGFQFPFGSRATLINTNGDRFEHTSVYARGAFSQADEARTIASQKLESSIDDAEQARAWIAAILDGDGALGAC